MQQHMSWSNHYEPSPKDWDQPQFYFPTYENDNLLCVLEEEGDEEDQGFCSDGSGAAAPPVLPEEVAAGLQQSVLMEAALRNSLLPTKRNS
jgi:hypothetical protein